MKTHGTPHEARPEAGHASAQAHQQISGALHAASFSRGHTVDQQARSADEPKVPTQSQRPQCGALAILKITRPNAALAKMSAIE